METMKPGAVFLCAYAYYGDKCVAKWDVEQGGGNQHQLAVYVKK